MPPFRRGTVEVAPGYYRIGAIYLKSNVNLHLNQGTTLIASEDIDLYPEMRSRVAGIEMVWPSAVINITDAENAAISGAGTLDCRGKILRDKYWTMRKDYEKRKLRWIVDYDCKRVRGMLISNSRQDNTERLYLDAYRILGLPGAVFRPMYLERTENQ